MTGSSVYSNMKPSCLHIKVTNKIELIEINSESHSQAELAQNRVHWRALVLRVLLRKSYFISNADFMELCFQDGRWNTLRVIKSRRMRWVGHVARMGERRGVYRVLVGKPEGKRPLERPRRRWEDNIKMDFRKLDVGAWTGSNWFGIGIGGGHL